MRFLLNVLVYEFYYREVQEILPNIAEQVVNDVKEAQVKYNLTVSDEPAAKALKEQVISIAKPDHRIKQLVCKFS